MPAKLSTRIDRIRDQLNALDRDLAKTRGHHSRNARLRVDEAIRHLDLGSDALHFHERAVARRGHR